MRPSVSVFGCMVLIIVASHTGLADEDKKKPAEAPKEQTVVDYDSKTHGAVQVKSVSEKPRDSFDVLRDGKRAFDGNPKLLNSTLELAPGTYVVVVNRTERKVNIEAGKKTILLTGDLIVESKKGNFWIPKQGKETRLAANPPVVNSSVAIFPGTYTVYVDLGVGLDLKNLGEAEVKAGKKTVVKD